MMLLPAEDSGWIHVVLVDYFFPNIASNGTITNFIFDMQVLHFGAEFLSKSRLMRGSWKYTFM